MPSPVVIFLEDGGYQRAWLAASIALSAQAAGDHVTLVLAFDALAAWVEGRLGHADGKGDLEARARGAALGAAEPARMLDEARALGARLWACETIVQLSGVSPEAARARLDQVLGLQQIWRHTDGARLLSF